MNPAAPDAKTWATWQAKAALSGVALHRIEGDNGRPLYVATEGAYSRQMDTPDQVADFLRRRTGKAVEATT